jgi:DNA topoisomerase-1
MPLLAAISIPAGGRQTVGSTDVNAYLREITGQDFTAKDFRTWAGTVLAARALREIGPFTTQTQVRRNVTQAIKQVAAQLGNTVAICRKSYVHPAIVQSYLKGTLLVELEQFSDLPPQEGLHPEEAQVMVWFQSVVRSP